jgi:hypothetical protein
MRFTPLGMIALLLGLVLMPGAFAAMMLVEHRLGIGSPYRMVFGLISALGAFTAVWSLVVIVIRYPDHVNTAGECLQSNQKLVYFVIFPLLYIGISVLSNCLRS